MSSKLSKILTIIILVIAVIGAVLYAGVLTSEEDSVYSSVSPLVEFSAWLLYATLAITVVFAVVNIFKNPEDLKKIAINVAILGLVYVVAYVTASDAAVLDVQGQILEGGEAGATSKLISTIINYSVYLGAIAIAVVGLGAVKTAIK
ncbi:hypothetical protein [Wenyingzhuangia sp. 2_MG-2023]|uniref:hypothetical protein n=1 Tax=Wenyingzhuangia sp. 2_MG-2023 TaxID=3062639 RepID=UPI0026E1983F|nr:hypothetical protein [Wenyingzhuangia sp. 2_MG-2023]MDO6738178.1 hypothetical protein [Wenyingzhuangia sp. 2_MG-2023]MDO6801498.1 hypothetical protein [Wenyingzhuangia sp. 1_MG-2023]